MPGRRPSNLTGTPVRHELEQTSFTDTTAAGRLSPGLGYAMTGAYLRMTVATALLGSYLIAGKVIVKEAPVFTATLVRLVSAAIVLSVYVAYTKPRRPSISKRDCAVLFAQAFLGVFLFSVCALYGVKFTGGIESGVILSMVPIAICVVALVFLKESLTPWRGLGIALSVVGAASINVMAMDESAGVSSNIALGALLLTGAVMCEAVFVTFGKLLDSPLSPSVLSLILAIVGSALFIVPAGFELPGVLRSHISWQTWAMMIYTGVAINGVAVVLVYDALDRLDTTVVAAFTALTPVSGTILAMVFLGEKLYTFHVVGMVLVVAGVFIVAREVNAAGRKDRQAAPAVFGDERDHQLVAKEC